MIAKLFNTYKFADYKEQVIDLLQRVCTISVETTAIALPQIRFPHAIALEQFSRIPS